MIKTLIQRLALFLLLPVALLLFFTGFSGFLYVKKVLIDEWREAAILKLERAAHHIDMRLNGPIKWIELFHETAGDRNGSATQAWILARLKRAEGVAEVDLKWMNDPKDRGHGKMHESGTGARGMMHFHRARISQMTPPRYDAETGHETVTLISDLIDRSGLLAGRLEVSLRFDYLMQDIKQFGWWQSDMACLIDETGRYLSHSEAMKGRSRLGETKDPAELAVLENMHKRPFGTYLGSGHPPDFVSGFYRIGRAPWVIVMIASGEKILAPIIRFLLSYAVAGIFCIVSILVLIRYFGGSLVRPIHEISFTAGQIAKGDYGDPLPIKGSDEIARLTRSFNEMVEGLKERDFISNTFGRYVDQEIARKLMERPEAARLGGEKREAAILMSDVRGFMPLSETLTPEETISLLNHYFSRMIQVIQKHQGIIVDFFGDGVLVFFDPLGGPVSPTVHEAVRCALEMQEEMEPFNKEMREKRLPRMEMGIGLNLGEVVIGNIGSEARAKYGIVGRAVNITQRIQAEAKGGEVVLSGSAYRRVSDAFTVKRSLRAQLKGVQDEMELYVIGEEISAALSKG